MFGFSYYSSSDDSLRFHIYFDFLLHLGLLRGSASFPDDKELNCFFLHNKEGSHHGEAHEKSMNGTRSHGTPTTCVINCYRFVAGDRILGRYSVRSRVHHSRRILQWEQSSPVP